MPARPTPSTSAVPAWQRLDHHLLTYSPEFWLMGVHWIALFTGLLCLALAVIGGLVPATAAEHPDISRVQDLISALALALAAGWSWRYLARVTPRHASLHTGTSTLFLGHLLCLLLILLPTRVLPTVLFWRLDRVDTKRLDESIRAHVDACHCIMSDHVAATTDELEFARLACDALALRQTYDRICSDDDPEVDRALGVIDEVHAAHQLFVGQSKAAVVREVDDIDHPRFIHLAMEKRLHSSTWSRSSLGPFVGLHNLANAWCYRHSGGTGVCKPGPLLGHRRGIRRMESDSIYNPRYNYGSILLFGLFACLGALLLTCARMGAGGAVLKALGAVIAVDLVVTATMTYGQTDEGGDVAYPHVLRILVAAAFTAALALIMAGRPHARRSLGVRRIGEAFATLGCAIAPLPPILLFIDLADKPADGLLGMLADAAKLDVRELQDYAAMSARIGGIPIPWLAVAGAVVCSWMAAYVLVDALRRLRALPSR